MIKYIHGSKNSIDTDVHYVFEKLPSLTECKTFCSSNPIENRNIIIIKNGIVTECYKGTPDEVNNSLLDTYKLHKQDYELLVTRKVNRIVPLKIVRAIRIILSHISRSQYRAEVKQALKDNWIDKIKLLKEIDFNLINFSELNKNMSAEDIKKTIAFQIGQTLSLINGIELYDKEIIAEHYPSLKEYIFRVKDTDCNNLMIMLNIMLEEILKIKTIQTNEKITFTFNNCDYNIDLKTEKML